MLDACSVASRRQQPASSLSACSCGHHTAPAFWLWEWHCSCNSAPSSTVSSGHFIPVLLSEVPCCRLFSREHFLAAYMVRCHGSCEVWLGGSRAMQALQMCERRESTLLAQMQYSLAFCRQARPNSRVNGQTATAAPMNTESWMCKVSGTSPSCFYTLPLPCRPGRHAYKEVWHYTHSCIELPDEGI